jgi:hypothetical protein
LRALPWNTAQYLGQGILTDLTGCEARPAAPWGPYPGGGLQYFIPNPEYQVVIENIIEFVPIVPTP